MHLTRVQNVINNENMLIFHFANTHQLITVLTKPQKWPFKKISEHIIRKINERYITGITRLIGCEKKHRVKAKGGGYET